MVYPAPSSSSDHPARRAPIAYHAGDLVTTGGDGYPTLYEVLRVEADGALRVRCLMWAPGYSALIPADAVRPVSRILAATCPSTTR